MIHTLNAWNGKALIGHLHWNSTTDKLTFEYATEWKNNPQRFPISTALPLLTNLHQDKAVRPFISGLLPDNEDTLKAWGYQFQISHDNPFRILEKVGTDCAGAIQFVPETETENWLATSGSIQPVSKDDLIHRITQLLKNHGATRSRSDTGQFSLPGAQPKLALHQCPNTQQWGIPSGYIPTTHILKPATGQLKHYAQNEHFCLLLTQNLGLPCARSRVEFIGKHPIIIVERYDRYNVDGQYYRIHQEDLAQALSVMPYQKYQNEGGPSVKDIARKILDVSNSPTEDLKLFARSLILNWLIGGTDSHAKNYSLLITHNQIRLTPLYDISTILLEPSRFPANKAKHAFKIGSQYALRHIKPNDWKHCAKDLALSQDYLFSEIETFSKVIPHVAQLTLQSLQDTPIHSTVTPLPPRIETHIKNCMKHYPSFL